MIGPTGLTATYSCWSGMIDRCTNPKNISWANYGGRGIEVHARWDEFKYFLLDMGIKPRGLSLDRIHNDGDYEPGNCRWATPLEQAHNRRPRAKFGKSRTGIRSVVAFQGKFHARPSIFGKLHHVGSFADARDAAEASWLAHILAGDAEGADRLMRSIPASYDAARMASCASATGKRRAA